MAKAAFTFNDLARECQVESGHYLLDGRQLGLRIVIPEALKSEYPYNGSAYGFLQQLRAEIFASGIVEFPGLPVNPVNHTLIQRAPQQHSYSSNTYMTDRCQSPHQDTPPYPTAFWLNQPRKYFATWVVSQQGMQKFYDCLDQKLLSVEQIHSYLVPQTLMDKSGLLLNQLPGLLLIDNSSSQNLYHARTCDFTAQASHPGFETDTGMYAFNEVGLLHYIDRLDSRRGGADRDDTEKHQILEFMQKEGLS